MFLQQSWVEKMINERKEEVITEEVTLETSSIPSDFLFKDFWKHSCIWWLFSRQSHLRQ